jgi:hypothetical protein
MEPAEKWKTGRDFDRQSGAGRQTADFGPRASDFGGQATERRDLYNLSRPVILSGALLRFAKLPLTCAFDPEKIPNNDTR